MNFISYFVLFCLWLAMDCDCGGETGSSFFVYTLRQCVVILSELALQRVLREDYSRWRFLRCFLPIEGISVSDLDQVSRIIQVVISRIVKTIVVEFSVSFMVVEAGIDSIALAGDIDLPHHDVEVLQRIFHILVLV